MGSGKTTVGEILARQLHCSFLDTDEWIVQKEKRSISDIFQTDGEVYFRKEETKALYEIAKQQERYVLSTGGGLPIQEENHKPLKEAGIVIYLQISKESVCKRLKKDRTRPLLNTKNPEKQVERLLKIREPIYEKVADMIIQTDEKSVKEVVAEILEKISEAGKEE